MNFSLAVPILYIIPSLKPGGAEYQIIHQVNFLQRQGVAVNLVVLSHHVDLIGHLKMPSENIHVLGIRGIGTLGIKSLIKTPSALIRLACVLKKIQPDVVVSILPLSHLLGRLHQWFYHAGYKHWCYHRSMQFEANPLNTWSKKLFHQFNQWLSRRYDHGHLFISAAVKENIGAHLPIRNGHVLYNAVPERQVDKRAAEEFLHQKHFVKARYHIVIPGRLHPAKGHLFFLDAVANYLRRLSPEEIQVVIVGGGGLEGQIKDRVRALDLGRFICLTGYVDNEVMLSYFKWADLVCIPSINEGFGNVAIEALSQGATVLASNTGGLPEIIRHGENGFLFERENGEDLLEKLEMLYTQKVKLDPVGLVADYRARFTLEAQVDRLLAILKETS